MSNEQKKSDTSKIITIPNALSLLRLLLVPVFAYIYLKQPFGESSYTWTIVVLVISSLTDLADGQIARRFNMVSDLGKLLDPIADKVTQGVMMICLLSRFEIMWLPLFLLAGKEIIDFLTHMRVTQVTGEVQCAEWHGKLSTTILDITVILHVLWWDIPETVTLVLVIVNMVLMVLSMVLYTIRNVKAINDYRRRSSNNA